MMYINPHQGIQFLFTRTGYFSCRDHELLKAR
jgi:hypothetical protein